jgi:hypothetical protein
MMIIIIATKYYNSGPLATHRALGGGRAVRFSHVNLTGCASPLVPRGDVRDVDIYVDIYMRFNTGHRERSPVFVPTKQAYKSR